MEFVYKRKRSTTVDILKKASRYNYVSLSRVVNKSA